MKLLPFYCMKEYKYPSFLQKFEFSSYLSSSYLNETWQKCWVRVGAFAAKMKVVYFCLVH